MHSKHFLENYSGATCPAEMNQHELDILSGFILPILPMNKCILAPLSFLLLIVTINSFGQNTDFQPGAIWMDNNGKHINAHGGGITLFNKKYYWYGEHKIEGDAGNRAHVGVHVYSSSDLYNWKDEGIALKVEETDSLHDIFKGCILERPKVIYNKKTRKFVMWFHLELYHQGYRASRSGVAVADNPVGPFTFLRSFRPNAKYWPINVQPYHKKPVAKTVKRGYGGSFGGLPAHPDSLNLLGRDFEGGQMVRDMNLFVDDDDVAYHIYSSEENSTIQISQLTDDYLSYSGKYTRIFVNRYMEAPTLFKASTGIYFFIGSDCTGWSPNAARSASAPSIWGPWNELGNPCVGNDSNFTFQSQSTYILPWRGKKDAFIFIGDRWTPKNAIDGRYIWLPIEIVDGKLKIRWLDKWNLEYFNK